MNKHRLAAGLLAAFGLTSVAAHADSLSDIISEGHVDGELRVYQFNRNYETNATPDQKAFSTTLLLNAQTGTFGGGFSLGASFASAQSFGTQSDNTAKIDSTLMGPNDSTNALTQAFLQYKNDWLLARGGYQYLNTPWMGGNDSRVIPSSYNAIMAQITVAKGWDVIGIRTFSWKSRTSDGYTSDNLYYPSTYDGDQMYGNTAALPATARDATGTWALGTTYAGGGLKAQAWYYNFIDFARTGYAEGTYTFKNDSGVLPYVGAQYLTQNGSSDNILVEYGAKLLGTAGHKVDSEAWGAKAGVNIGPAGLEVAYNKLDQQNGAVGDGALISPYSAGYATDPLYTTSMIRGLVEEGPGHAWKAKATYNLLDNHLQLVAAYAKYTTVLRGDSHNAYIDIIYKLDGFMKGLTLRDRWERSSGGINNLNPGNRAFTYNRLMLTYKF